ncbi:retinoid-inducible serine carboxypeptidase-like isoform X2 [Plodia interpunctella]|nr:retinoid-inducible serine carboxypeptidase-like isoform X2 [Plodia interpunctella]
MVRPGAYMFYWLYYADGTSVGADDKPLIIWIQGGPGLAASIVANFGEIGPLDMDFQPRNHTWVKGRNLLLIDHPVGTGFSYVKNNSLLVKNDKEIAVDLTKAVKAFFRRHKEFRNTPTYIFGQSYGGKMCPRVAFYLHTAIQRKRLKMNFKGIGIGSAWVDPKESTMMFPEFMYMMGIIDQITYLKSMEVTKKFNNAMNKKEYVQADKWYNLLFTTIVTEIGGYEANFYNINREKTEAALERFDVQVNRYVKPVLPVNQSIEYSYTSALVFDNLNISFLFPTTKFLEFLLNTTDLKIAVYNGNLDVITSLAGASNWIHKLKWYGAEEFRHAKRLPINGEKNCYYKTANQLSFWSVFRAGHWIPEDNPEAMAHILDTMLD